MFKLSLCLIFLTTAALFAGCSGKTIKIFPNDEFTKKARSRYDATLAEMERNRQLWRESKIENYDFKTECHSGNWQTTFPGAALKVRQGKIVSMEKVQKDNLTDFSDYEKQATTIENAFELIRKELDDDRIIEVKYNEKLGYPERMDIIFSDAIDNSSVFFVSGFEIVK